MLIAVVAVVLEIVMGEAVHPIEFIGANNCEDTHRKIEKRTTDDYMDICLDGRLQRKEATKDIQTETCSNDR